MTVNLAYCTSCGYHQQTITLPMDAPLGSYRVSLFASRIGYDPAQATSTIFVAPPLTMTLEVAPAVVLPLTPLTLMARVYERGMAVTQAAVYAAISTPGGIVTTPLVYNGGVYTTTLSPVDLEPNLGGALSGGQWTIGATADYYGSLATASATVTVNIPPSNKLYLPLVLKNP
jgi:hypothetical protein